jgi:hypothetical protein
VTFHGESSRDSEVLDPRAPHPRRVGDLARLGLDAVTTPHKASPGPHVRMTVVAGPSAGAVPTAGNIAGSASPAARYALPARRTPPASIRRSEPHLEPDFEAASATPQHPLGGRGRAARVQSWLDRSDVRRPLLAVAATLQVLIIISALAWLTTSMSPVEPAAATTPVSWTGVVHDVDSAGVILRTAPAVMPGTARRTAALAEHLQIVCGQTGDVVLGGSTGSSIWFKTTDNLFVSELYVEVLGRTEVANCQ